LSSTPSLATTTPHPAPSQPTRSQRRADSRREGASLPWRYLGYVGYYVGAGLISGAVVHHPMAPARNEDQEGGSGSTDPASQPTASPNATHPSKEPGHDDGHQH
jgi:hypothetical protein